MGTPPGAPGGTRDKGPGIRDQGPRTREQGPGTKDQGPGTGDQGPGTRTPSWLQIGGPNLSHNFLHLKYDANFEAQMLVTTLWAQIQALKSRR